ncbi:MAG: phosphotransferase [Saprospiraceae bacterium]|nr:phosphotransferase [Saprospiraceae bacterium]
MKEQNSMSVSKVERSMKLLGTGFKVGANYIKHYSKKVVNPGKDRTDLDEANASDIYDTLSHLKGSALKVAQMLSMDKGILPGAYSEKFSLALNSAPPLSGPLIIKTFQRHFGKSPFDIYDTFEMKASHAASIGQVHKATKDGVHLAVKIQYPGVADSISSDLKMVKPFAFRLLGMSESELAVYLKEVEDKLIEETDYVNELQQGTFIGNACKEIESLRFPKYFPEYSNDRILTMEWLEGQPLRDFIASNPGQEKRNQIGQALWDFYSFQQHELKLIHADPHPGNFLVDNEGNLAIVDFGCVKEIPQDFYEAFFGLVYPPAGTGLDKMQEWMFQLEMLSRKDDPEKIKFFTSMYLEMIGLFGKPYLNDTFDFGDPEFINALYSFGEKATKIPELREARGSRHFIYVNRTNFGLYNILHELKAEVNTGKFSFQTGEVV